MSKFLMNNPKPIDNLIPKPVANDNGFDNE